MVGFTLPVTKAVSDLIQMAPQCSISCSINHVHLRVCFFFGSFFRYDIALSVTSHSHRASHERDFGDVRGWGLAGLVYQACHLLKSCWEIILSKISPFSSLLTTNEVIYVRAVKFRLCVANYLLNN